MYEQIASIVALLYLSLCVAAVLHVSGVMYKVIYDGQIEPKDIMSLLFNVVVFYVLAVILAFVGVIIIKFTWPVVLILAFAFASHPAYREEFVGSLRNPGARLLMFPLTILWSIHKIIVDECATVMLREFCIRRY